MNDISNKNYNNILKNNKRTNVINKISSTFAKNIKINIGKHIYKLENNNNRFKKITNKIIKRNIYMNKLKRDELIDFYQIGQFNNKFIIFKNRKNKNLILIDQHALHERIIYESIITRFKEEFYLMFNLNKNCALKFSKEELELNNQYKFLFNNSYSSVKLKEPIIITISKIIIDFKFEDFEGFNSIFNIEFKVNTQKNIVIIYTSPIIYDRLLDCKETIELLLNLLNNFSILFTKELSYNSLKNNADKLYLNINKYTYSTYINNLIYYVFDKYLKSKSCRNSIMFNDILDNKLITIMYKQMIMCNKPFLCAHGRHNFFLIYNINYL